MFKISKIIDISLPLQENMVIYPGNPEFSLEFIKKIPEFTSTVSKLSIGSHSGTHVDAPKHVDENGKPISFTDISKLIGPAIVIDCTEVDFGNGITKEILQTKPIKPNMIILLKTKNSKRGYSTFYSDFIFVDSTGADYLLEKKVRSIGVDYLGIQKYHSGNNIVHKAFLDKEIPIIEGLNLSAASQGTYFLSCLPLNVINAEASMARAVLIEGG